MFASKMNENYLKPQIEIRLGTDPGFSFRGGGGGGHNIMHAHHEREAQSPFIYGRGPGSA